MKKLLLTTGIIVLFIFNLQAQDDKDFVKDKTTFGIKGGINFSEISVKDRSRHNHGVELQGGLFMRTYISDKWSFQNEILYSYTGPYDYIEFPFLLRYHINDRWTIFAGPKLDFILNQDSEFSPFSEFRDDYFKTFGVSGVIGVEYKISKNLFIEGTYNHSFTRQIYTYGGDHSINRRTFRLSLGYRF